jgi:hypothetical protein
MDLLVAGLSMIERAKKINFGYFFFVCHTKSAVCSVLVDATAQQFEVIWFSGLWIHCFNAAWLSVCGCREA